MKQLQFISTALLFAGSAQAQELAELTASDAGNRDYYGQAVALAAGTALVGAPGNNDNGGDSGSVYVYTGSGTSWSEQAKLLAGDARAFDAFGFVLEISGESAVIGAYGDDHVDFTGTNEGSAYVVVRSGTSWSEEAKLMAGDAAADDEFGIAAAISGDTVVIGASGDDDLGVESGSAYVFVRSGTTWSEEAKLTASDGAEDDHFGISVAIDGDTIVVGAERDGDGGPSSGSAYVFVRSGTNWSEEAKLTAADSSDDDNFGSTVALALDTAVIGAPGEDDGGISAGAAYVFTRSGTTWTEQSKLVAGDAEGRDAFGQSVAIADGMIVAGAPGKTSVVGASSGASYVYEGAGASWSQIYKLTADETGRADFFGSRVAIAGSEALIGSAWDDDDGIDTGSAHMFSVDPPEVTPYCVSAPNSQGPGGATIAGTGTSIAANNLTLSCEPIAPGQPGIFYYGPIAFFVGAPPFGEGFRCVGGSAVRILPPVFSNGAGVLTTSVDNTSLFDNPGGALAPGNTVHFQSWYRDPVCPGPGGPGDCNQDGVDSGFNLSDGLSVTFSP